MAKAKDKGARSGLDKLSASEREAYRRLAAEANLEIYQLALTVCKLMDECSTGWGSELAIRGMCTRIADLTNIVFGAYLSDDELTEINQVRCELGTARA